MNHYKEISVLLVLYQEDVNLIKKNLINLKNFKIIIIDNDSNLELKRKIENDFHIHKYIVNPQNNGYTKALNQAIRACDTKYAITINADCNISEFSILKLFEGYQKYQNCFITAPISYSKELKLTYSAGSFPELFFNNKPIAISGDVCFQIVLGSAMFFETKKMIKIGLLDENFFIYYSDYDLCRRINQIKKSVIQIKEAYCTHEHGISKVRNKYKRIFLRENNYIFDELYYFYKINAHSIILLGLKKKIFKYFIKIFSNFLILEFEKTTLFSARVFAYFRFLFLIKKITP